MIRLGIRAHDFGKLPADVLTKNISEKGFTCIQLQEAIEGLNDVYGKLNPRMANYIEDTFRRQNIQIAVLSCYINPINPDEGARKKQIDSFKEYIRFARDFGCSIVATETGSLNKDFSFNSGNHSEKSFQSLMKSLEEMDTDCDKMVEESFNLFGDRIAAFHAKDFIIENGEIKTVQIGQGMMNYALILKLMVLYTKSLSMMMEQSKKTGYGQKTRSSCQPPTA